MARMQAVPMATLPSDPRSCTCLGQVPSCVHGGDDGQDSPEFSRFRVLVHKPQPGRRTQAYRGRLLQLGKVNSFWQKSL